MTLDIARHSGCAIRYTKLAIEERFCCDFGAGLDREAYYFSRAFESKDKQEGISAFLENRSPCFD